MIWNHLIVDNLCLQDTKCYHLSVHNKVLYSPLLKFWVKHQQLPCQVLLCFNPSEDYKAFPSRQVRFICRDYNLKNFWRVYPFLVHLGHVIISGSFSFDYQLKLPRWGQFIFNDAFSFMYHVYVRRAKSTAICYVNYLLLYDFR